MFTPRNGSALLDNNFVSSSAVILFIMTMQVLGPGHPEADLIVPVIAICFHGAGFVVSSLHCDSSIFLFAGCKLDESCS